MQYKGKTLVTPPQNTKYIPVIVKTATEKKTMGISDIELVGDTKYTKLGEDTYLWSIEEENRTKKTLTPDCYHMMDVYPEDYKTMTEVPDELDISGLTSLSRMFSETKTLKYGEDSEYKGEYQDGDGGCRQMVAAPSMDTGHITDMSRMFGTGMRIQYQIPGNPRPGNHDYINACVSLVDVPRYNTENVVRFTCMFYGCVSLPKIFPWPINIAAALADSKASQNLNGMFAKSSVEEATFICPNTDTYSTLINNYVTLGNLDSDGTLKKISIVEHEGDKPWKVIQSSQEE